MRINDVLAGVAVSDIEAAVGWYERLLGRPPSDRPMPSLAEWRMDAHTLQVVHDAERAGSSLVTLDIDDIGAVVGELARAGLAPEAPEVASGITVRFAQVADPDGNVITLVESPPA